MNLVIAGCIYLLALSPSDPTDDEVAMQLVRWDIPRKWQDNNLVTVRNELDHLFNAYELDEGIRPQVWQRAYEIMTEQYLAEREFFKTDFTKIPPDEALKLSNDFYGRMPLTPDRLRLATEEILGGGDFLTERRRWKDLRDRRAQQILVGDEDLRRRAGFKRRITEEKEFRICKLTAEGKPIPQSLYWAREYAKRQTREEQTVRPQVSARSSRVVHPDIASRPKQESSTSEMEAPRSETVLSLARDSLRAEWQTALKDFKAKKTVDAAKAELVGEKLWDRVGAYRQAHHEQYQQVDALESWNAWEAAMVSLDAPARAIFQEFQSRLDALVPQNEGGSEIPQD